MIGGVLAVFLTDNAAGSASLVTLGALVIATAAFSDRIESLEFGGAKLKLRDLVRQRFALAAQKESEGDTTTAARLRKQAHGFQRLAGTYGRIRRSTPGGPDRTEILDEVIAQARQLAEDVEFDPVDVWSWFDEGDEQSRVIVLGLMQGDERVRDIFCALDAIENPRSLFEQYHALHVAQQMIDDDGLSDLERTWLRDVVMQAQQAAHFRADPFAMPLSEQIVTALQDCAG